MSDRTPLPSGTVLAFPGLSVTVGRPLGQGRNAIAYEARYFDKTLSGQEHFCIVKELFPLEAGIHRAPSGHVKVEEWGEEAWEEHRRSFLRGNEVHLEILRKNPALWGENWNTYEANGTYYTVLETKGGRTLLERIEEPYTLGDVVSWMKGLLEGVTALHAEGILHLDISPDNILLIPREEREEVLLIDYNSAYSLKQWQGGRISFSAKEGYSAPEVIRREHSSISFPADLFSCAAVLFFCLYGRPLAIHELVARDRPDGETAPLLQDASQPVRSMIRKIFFLGLQTSPSCRYRSAVMLKRDLEELLRRMEGVGVTHWAIWERERMLQERRLTENPAMAFLRSGDLYPIWVEAEGEKRSLPEFHLFLLNQRKPVFLQAPGGMGKTTLLQVLSLRQNKVYAAARTAAIYVSLSSYREGERFFIHDRVLSFLKFPKEIQDYTMARHELDLLFAEPFQLREGIQPRFLLLLDGLNEAAGKAEGLLEEISSLSSLAGVQLLITSRTNPEGVSDPLKASLLPLDEEKMRQILGERGILLPEAKEKKEILSTPLFLSMFIETVQAGEAAIAFSQWDDLLESFLCAMGKKMEAGQERNDALRYQKEAALFFLFPAIAARQRKDGRPLKEEALFRTAERSYRLLLSRDLGFVFPRWAGHRDDIRGNTSSADAWYKRLVLDFLWHQTGLLFREEDGSFRVFHEALSDWLCQREGENRVMLRRRRSLRLRGALIGVSCFLLGIASYWRFFVYQKPYSQALTERIMDMGTLLYADFAKLYQSVEECLLAGETKDTEGLLRAIQTALEELEPFRENLGVTGRAIETAEAGSYRRAAVEAALDEAGNGKMASTVAVLAAKEEKEGAQIIKDSSLPLDVDAFVSLADYTAERAEFYGRWLEIWAGLLEAFSESEEPGRFPAGLRSVLEADAAVFCDLLYLATDQHIQSGALLYRSVGAEDYDDLLRRQEGLYAAYEKTRLSAGPVKEKLQKDLRNREEREQALASDEDLYSALKG